MLGFVTFAVLRGLGLGIVAAIGVGFIVSVAMTVHGWPSGGGPTERARHLAEGISTGMHVAWLASIILVPSALFWSVRRRRRRA